MSSPELRPYPPSKATARSITELFHRINSLLPDTQQVVAVQGEPSSSGSEKLELT
jgi:hypothetical protein